MVIMTHPAGTPAGMTHPNLAPTEPSCCCAQDFRTVDQRIVPGSAHQAMLAVGVIKIVAGIAVAVVPRYGALAALAFDRGKALA